MKLYRTIVSLSLGLEVKRFVGPAHPTLKPGSWLGLELGEGPFTPTLLGIRSSFIFEHFSRSGTNDLFSLFSPLAVLHH